MSTIKQRLKAAQQYFERLQADKTITEPVFVYIPDNGRDDDRLPGVYGKVTIYTPEDDQED